MPCPNHWTTTEFPLLHLQYLEFGHFISQQVQVAHGPICRNRTLSTSPTNIPQCNGSQATATVPGGETWQCLKTSLRVTNAEGGEEGEGGCELLLPSSGQRPGMLLNISQCMRRRPPHRARRPQVSSAEVQLPCWRGRNAPAGRPPH